MGTADPRRGDGMTVKDFAVGAVMAAYVIAFWWGVWFLLSR